jgi:hypothetical protein
MAQDNALVDYFRKGQDAANKIEGAIMKIPTPDDYFKKKTDTSWHDSMVKRANDSFKSKKLTAKGPTLGGKKKSKAKTQKSPARKKD